MSGVPARALPKIKSVVGRSDNPAEAAGAASAGLSLRPTTLLIFGNARAGTPLMQSIQTIGIDLPLKALVWQDAAGVTWLSYNDLSWLAKRHGLGPEGHATVSAMAAALDAMAKKAT